MTYEEVVNKAKLAVKNRGIYGDINLADCEEWQAGNQINLWSYWQGYQIEDINKGIDILLVGQDWGNPASNPKIMKLIRDIQAGNADCTYADIATSMTDRNLKDLFSILKCDINSSNPGKRILFTNYCLAYRTGSETGGMTKTLMNMDEEIFKDLVDSVKPKIIICLGKITYEAVTGKIANDFVKLLKQGKPFQGVFKYNNDIKVYGVAHCGARGVSNVGGIDTMYSTWREIGEAEGYIYSIDDFADRFSSPIGITLLDEIEGVEKNKDIKTNKKYIGINKTYSLHPNTIEAFSDICKEQGKDENEELNLIMMRYIAEYTMRAQGVDL
ncbi:MAG: hypothetical protein IKW81_07310 [Pseudobutyrivibrio sp.]|nr:hypothetical protein [Pseudobutyrivibrio sp.]